MLRAYEGYLEKGRFFPIGPPLSVRGRRRVIVTVLDEPPPETARENDRVWLYEFHRLAEASSHEALRDEDFPRLSLGRELLTFDDEG